MPKLPEQYSAMHDYERMYNIWKETPKYKREGMTLGVTALKTFRRQMVNLLILIIVVVGLFLMGPFITSFNIDFIENNQDDTSSGIILFLLTLFVTLIHKVLFSQLMYRFSWLGINLNNAFTMMIYCKALKFSSLANK